jgi:hypothetical protein
MGRCARLSLKEFAGTLLEGFGLTCLFAAVVAPPAWLVLCGVGVISMTLTGLVRTWLGFVGIGCVWLTAAAVGMTIELLRSMSEPDQDQLHPTSHTK